MRPRHVALVVAAATFALVCPATASATPTTAWATASATAGSDPYVVIYRAGAAPGARVSALATTKAQFRYHAALHGFAARLDAAQLAAVRNDPAVATVVPDVRVTTNTTNTPNTPNTPNPSDAGPRPISAGTSTHLRPPWGLDRIDQRTLPLDNAYTPPGDGTGVTVYVLDTGVRATHTELAGRVSAGINVAPHTSDTHPGTEVDPADTSDCDGHGTHVAGTIGGRTVGVAGNVTIVPVRVLDCEGSGTLSGVIAGVDWVTAQHRGPAVANLSLGTDAGEGTTPLSDAITASVAAGVVYAVAAGNESSDACTTSPADTPDALTVGASTVADAAAGYSNYGSCVDLYAPGSDIASAWPSSDTGTALLSGTSMATPHVAGVAALLLQQDPDATPAQVSAVLIADAVPDLLQDVATEWGDPNLLLQVPADAGTGTDTTAPRVTGLTGVVSGRSVAVTATAVDPTPASTSDTDASGIKGFSYVWSRTRAPATTAGLGSLDGRLTTQLADGGWYVHVRAVDLAGNASAVATAGPFRVDVEAPRLLRVRLVEASGNRFRMQLTGSDSSSGLAGFAVIWNRSRSAVSGASQFAGTGSGTAVTIRSPKLAAGTWYLHVRARDRAGHWSGWRTVGPLRSTPAKAARR